MISGNREAQKKKGLPRKRLWSFGLCIEALLLCETLDDFTSFGLEMFLQ